MRNYDLEFLKHFSMVIGFLMLVTAGLIVGAYFLHDSLPPEVNPKTAQITEGLAFVNIFLLVFAGIALFNWSLFARYDFTGKSLNGLSVSLGYKTVADRFGDGANSFILPEYEILSAGIGYARASWRIQLQVENVLNEEYLSTAVNFSNIYFGDPRRFRLTTTYSF